jgi:vesicular inhibitory amino acid transporter
MYGERMDSQITPNLPTTQAMAIYTTLFIPVTRYALMLSPLAGEDDTNKQKKLNTKE